MNTYKTKRLQESCEKLDCGLPPDKEAGLFGLSLLPEDAEIVIVGVSWDVTTSYGEGTKDAPEAIRIASHQLDLVDRVMGSVFRRGIAFENSLEISEMGLPLRLAAKRVISALESSKTPSNSDLEIVNRGSERLNNLVFERTKKLITEGKKIGILGGDHSTPYGAIKAHAMSCEFGILHVDAHHDLRDAYEGFEHSHASIFHNVLKDIPNVKKLVSVGIRDFSADEAKFAADDDRIATFYDEEIFHFKANGQNFAEISRNIISQLPQNVYVSIDIDGLSQEFCPHTGTPVPGGLSFQELAFLIHELYKSGKKVIGFDLVEVGNHEWDANVAARILYKMCGLL